MLRSDWDGFLVVDPPPARRSWLRRYGPGVLIAAALAAIAWWLPVAFPDLVTDPGPFRLTLAIAAVSALFAPDVHQATAAVQTFRK